MVYAGSLDNSTLALIEKRSAILRGAECERWVLDGLLACLSLGDPFTSAAVCRNAEIAQIPSLLLGAVKSIPDCGCDNRDKADIRVVLSLNAEARCANAGCPHALDIIKRTLDYIAPYGCRFAPRDTKFTPLVIAIPLADRTVFEIVEAVGEFSFISSALDLSDLITS